MATADKIRTDLTNTYWSAKHCFEVWFQVDWESEFRQTHLGMMNKYLGFFSPVIDSLEFTLVVKLASMYDSGKDCITLQKLLNKLLSDGKAGHPSSILSLQQIQAKINAIKPKADALYAERSKYRAHRLIRIHNPTDVDPAITNNEVKELLYSSEEILNDLGLYMDGFAPIGFCIPDSMKHTRNALEVLNADFIKRNLEDWEDW